MVKMLKTLQPFQAPAILASDISLTQDFNNALYHLRMELCGRCKKQWFDMDLRQQVCAICRQKDKNRGPNEPCFSAENDLDFGPSHVELGLPDLTMTEQLLIAKVHVLIQVRQVKGAQYRYQGHTVSFARNIVKLYETSLDSRRPRSYIPEALKCW